MVNNCVVRGCASSWRPGSDQRFHGFPKNATRRKMWLSAVPLKTVFYEYARICNLHFQESDYDPIGRLKQTAVPCIEITHKTASPCEMSSLSRSDASPNFFDVLYGEDSEDEDEVDEEFMDDKQEFFSENEELEPASWDSITPTPPAYSPLTSSSTPQLSPRREGLQSRSWSRIREGLRSRSRSPIRPSPVREMEKDPFRDPLPVVIKIYDKDGLTVDPVSPIQEEFVVPDSHFQFESPRNVDVVVERCVERRSGRRTSVRGRVRGGRGGRVNRGQSIGRGRVCRQHDWQVGQPLEEIWMTDDDVSPELRALAMDVARKRQARVVKERQIRRRAVRVEDEAQIEGDSESENDEAFEDAIDDWSNSHLDGVDLHFDWSPMATFRNVEEIFAPERTGSVFSHSSPYDAFRSFWDDSIIQVIVEETNRYASWIQSASFQASWYPTNAHEILCLFAFWMMTDIIRMPTIKSYFSSNSLLKTEIFSRITTLPRYTDLNRALNFVDTSATNSTYPTNNGVASSDPLHRLRPIIDHLNSKFKSNYVPSKDICIDESLTLWKGRLQFKQYIRSKAAKFGIKTFELCESVTGYLWSFMVYTGKDSSSEMGPSKSTAIVLKLIEPLLNKGYRLFIDNLFNSPLLARILKRNGTDCVGTLGTSRVDVPTVVSHAPLKRGQLVARHSGDVCVLSWQDKNRVCMLSTCHGTATGLSHVSSRPPTRPEPYKPQAVLDYNHSMGGVDLKDQMLEPYLLERKRGAKWYIKLFKRLINFSINNSRVLLESCRRTREDNLKFRLELVHAILLSHHHQIPKNRSIISLSSGTFPCMIVNTHWPTWISQIEGAGCHTRRRCTVCYNEGRKTQRTIYQCEVCNVPLCVVNCFKKYHKLTVK